MSHDDIFLSHLTKSIFVLASSLCHTLIYWNPTIVDGNGRLIPFEADKFAYLRTDLAWYTM